MISRSLLPKNVKLLNIPTSIKGVSENRFICKQIALLYLKIDGKVFKHPFRVCEMDKQYAILGSDFLFFQYCKIDLRREVISIMYVGRPPDSVFIGPSKACYSVPEIIFQAISVQERPMFISTRWIKIKSKKHAYVHVKLVNFTKNNATTLFEPNSDFVKTSGLMVLPIIYDKESTRILVYNPTDHPVIISRYTSLGQPSADEIVSQFQHDPTASLLDIPDPDWMCASEEEEKEIQSRIESHSQFFDSKLFFFKSGHYS